MGKIANKENATPAKNGKVDTPKKSKSPKVTPMKAKGKKESKPEQKMEKTLEKVVIDESVKKEIKSPKKVETVEVVQKVEKKNQKNGQNKANDKKSKNDKKRKREDEEDSPSKKIKTCSERSAFIGKLQKKNDTAALTKYFSQFGAVENAKVISHKGFGFITFEEAESLDKALAAGKHTIDGNAVVVARKVDGNQKLGARGLETLVKLDKAVTKDSFGAYFSKLEEVRTYTFPGVNDKGYNNAGYAYITSEDEEKKAALLSKTHKVDGTEVVFLSRDHEVHVSGFNNTMTDVELQKAFSKFGAVLDVNRILKTSRYPSKGFRSYGFVLFKDAKSVKKAIAAASVKVGEKVLTIKSVTPRPEEDASKNVKKETKKDAAKKSKVVEEVEEEADDEEMEDEDDVEDEEESDDNAVEDGDDDAEEDGDDDAEEDGDDDAEEDGDDDAEEEGDDDAEEEGDDDAEEEGDDDAEEEGDDDAEEEGDDDAEEEGDDDAEEEGDDDAEEEGDDDAEEEEEDDDAEEEEEDDDAEEEEEEDDDDEEGEGELRSILKSTWVGSQEALPLVMEILKKEIRKIRELE